MEDKPVSKELSDWKYRMQCVSPVWREVPIWIISEVKIDLEIEIEMGMGGNWYG